MIPEVRFLFFQLDKLPRSGVCMMRARLVTETERYFRGGDSRQHFRDIESSELYALATILDPRYRTQCFLSADKADFAVEVLKERASEIEVNKTAASIVEESNPAGDEWALCMGTQADPIAAQPTSSADCEVTEYLKEKNIPRERCPFSWWAGNQQKFPLLSSLARRYLSAPMGSIASEREFKISKRIVEHRVNLKPDNVEMLLFMKYNLRMLDYNIWSVNHVYTAYLC